MIHVRKSRLIIATVLALPFLPAPAQKPSVDVGGGYTYVHSNIVPGCSCFSLNGGSAQLQIGATRHIAGVANVDVVSKTGITPDNYQLTQVTYTFGGRYTPSSQARFSPFGEALFGGAHALGTLSPANNAIHGGSNALALRTGGGLMLRVSWRLRIMPLEVDYLLTNFQNNANNRQNDIQVSAGVLFRLRR
jgi:outer membrane immunogenic protein